MLSTPASVGLDANQFLARLTRLAAEQRIGALVPDFLSLTCTAHVIEDSISTGGRRLTTLQLSYPRFLHAEVLTHSDSSRCAGAQEGLAPSALDPRGHSSIVMTATEWPDFLQLCERDDARPEFLALARHIREAMDASTPALRGNDRMDAACWHLPYVRPEERSGGADPHRLAKVSAARCARGGFLKPDGEAPIQEEDLALFQRLVDTVPMRASPAEHQAYPLANPLGWNKNLRGWFQHRTLVEQEAGFKLRRTFEESPHAAVPA